MILKSSPPPIPPCLRRPVSLPPFSKLGFCSVSSYPFASKLTNGEFRLRSTHDDRDGEEQPLTGFSVLSSDVPWDSESIWNIMGGYFFCFHVPLSFGGFPAISLDPQSKTVALIFLQSAELIAALLLLNYSRNKRFDLSEFFQDHHKKGRSPVKAAIIGLGFLLSVVLLTSLVADRLIGSKEVNNQELKEILENYPESGVGFFLIYSILTPALEEVVYRGFLLTSLAKEMEWRSAVVISAAVFGAAHLSVENFGQLFVIGCVLGSVYCWSGNLAASFAVHSLYNAILLFAMYLN